MNNDTKKSNFTRNNRPDVLRRSAFLTPPQPQIPVMPLVPQLPSSASEESVPEEPELYSANILGPGDNVSALAINDENSELQIITKRPSGDRPLLRKAEINSSLNPLEEFNENRYDTKKEAYLDGYIAGMNAKRRGSY